MKNFTSVTFGGAVCLYIPETNAHRERLYAPHLTSTSVTREVAAWLTAVFLKIARVVGVTIQQSTVRAERKPRELPSA
ncbi:hypothetical protein DPMN_058324 [Dreissena polymorpha]|uniref:Uncharacterized protein n=1 Tax=Dreissena polymorpha TaxID=45954 RepID=A0A9D4C1W3_DREPO|nr:hypothetical protein DPMN_058324 [Dreissena polymorpha]